MGAYSIGSKSLTWCKKVDVKLSGLFLLTDGLNRNLSYIAIILPLEFSKF